MTISVRAKEWGNSIGIILPKEFVMENSIKPGENIIITIERKQNALKDLFGTVAFSKPVGTLIKENRKGLEGKWL